MRLKYFHPLALTSTLALAPCAALAEVPMVLTDIPAVASLTAKVMGDLGTPEALLQPGSDEHHYQLRPTQARALQEADLLIWIGPELTPWLIPAAEGKESTSVLGLLQAEGTILRAYDDAHDHEDHDDHAAHGEHEGHDDHAAHDEHEGHDDHAAHDDHEGHDDHEAHDDHEGHVHEGTDPHAWLDPENAIIWVDVIAQRLAEQDPENAATYRANAQTAQAELTALLAELRETIAPVQDQPFITGHDAYGYLQARFSLNILGSILMGDASSGGAGHPRELLAMMKEEGAVCIFPETQQDAKPAMLLAEGSDVRVGEAIDPAGNAFDGGRDLYETLMRDIIGKIAACLKGA
ncbi:zinc ABC transporter substrate-binding protein [Albirhodobacter sp. R86504]|uniref:zinc ABC transporter substrate-binding protein n=1 Tax=Albirhodobacter sp. R86504 TaxID=3093848 RepID=UPI00366E226D